MITRPLDLASKLRPEPRNFDALFFVNVGLIVLFFALFGSRFVLAPGLAVDLPAVVGAEASARPPTHVITVTDSGQIFTSAGNRSLQDLRLWLREQAAGVREATLLVRADRQVSNALMVEITGAAYLAGFKHVLWAAKEAETPGKPGGR